MDIQFVFDAISRITHITTAITLAGGTAFVVFVLAPSARSILESEELKLRMSINQRWKRFVHVGILLFLVSGFYNYFRAMPAHKGDGVYHALIGTKILLALVMFFIASALVGRSKAFDFMRKRRIVWLRTIVLLAFAIVAISGVARVRGISTQSVPIEALNKANTFQ